MTLFVLRHGETGWSLARRHTGRSDIPLTDRGRGQAVAAGQLVRSLRGDRGEDVPWSLALTSPLSRAADTALLAGFDAEPDDRLREWDYGDYDGITSADIRAERPGWDLWRDGCPGGETGEQVAARVDALLDERVRPALNSGDVILVAHSHLLRVLAARWLGFDVDGGRHFVLDPAHVGVLDQEHEAPVLAGWNLGD